MDASQSSSGSNSPRYHARTRGPMNGAAGPRSPSGTGVRASPRSASTIVTPMTTAAVAAVPGRHSTPGSLPRQLAAQEALDVVARLVVGELLRRGVFQIPRGLPGG